MINSCKNILFVGAHPDDIELNAGGTISKLLRSKNDLNIFCLTLTNGCSKIRIQEMNSGLSSLGIVRANIFDDTFPENKLFKHEDDCIKSIEYEIVRCNIDTVFTHFFNDTHQDHRVASSAVSAAARNIPNIIYFKPTFPAGRPNIPFNPTFVIILEQEDINHKMDALRYHQSQLAKYGWDNWGRAQSQIAVADAWTYAGIHGYAEVFQIGRLRS